MSETRIAVVVRDDLALWQKLNVVVFLASGTGHDAANRGAVRQYVPDEMNMVDLAVREEKRLGDKITRGPKLHA
jgi:hypothetical protein